MILPFDILNNLAFFIKSDNFFEQIIIKKKKIYKNKKLFILIDPNCKHLKINCNCNNKNKDLINY